MDEKSPPTVPVTGDSVWKRDRVTLRGVFRFEYRSWFGENFLKRYPPPPPSDGPNYLQLGCGPNFHAGFVNADFYVTRLFSRKRRPDWMVDLRKPLKCPDNWFDGLFTEHVLEHLQPADALHFLTESLRILKPGAVARISVPDTRKFVMAYLGREDDGGLPYRFPDRADYLAALTQMHGHQSIWDEENLSRVLGETGFINIRRQDYRAGRNPDLLVDHVDRRDESLFMEAEKPLAS
ncbi:MAG: methyltransferase domain-containing protein [Rhodospirillales bacterium]|jgi:predicted SAM-dependent methyltransferase|nr:methyltransferase domain-containing protein [Rhodospirillales bacterium]